MQSWVSQDFLFGGLLAAQALSALVNKEEFSQESSCFQTNISWLLQALGARVQAWKKQCACVKNTISNKLKLCIYIVVVTMKVLLGRQCI